MHDNKTEDSIEQILDNCLEEIICSGRNVEDCLAKYPGHATELEPLLEMAIASQRAICINPREEFKARARYEFNAAVADMAQNGKKRWFNFAPVWAQAVVGVLIAIMISGGSMLAVSSNSLPGEALYGVKLAAEHVRMGLTFSDSARSELNADLANKRVAEIVTLAEMGQVEGIRDAASRLDDNLDTIAVLNVKSTQATQAPPPIEQQPEDITSMFEDVAGQNRQTPDLFVPSPDDNQLVSSLRQKGLEGYLELLSTLEKASENIRPAVEEALISYIQGYEAAIYQASR